MDKITPCTICSIENWLDCGCYYLYGGAGSKGDMNVQTKREKE